MFTAIIYVQDFLTGNGALNQYQLQNIPNQRFNNYLAFIQGMRARFAEQPEYFIVRVIFQTPNGQLYSPYFRIQSANLYIVGLFNDNLQYHPLTDDMQHYSIQEHTPYDWNYLVNAIWTMNNYVNNTNPIFNKEALKVIALYFCEAARFTLICRICRFEKARYAFEYGYICTQAKRDLFNNAYNDYMMLVEAERIGQTWGALKILLQNWASLCNQLETNNHNALVLPLPINAPEVLGYYPFLQARSRIPSLFDSDHSSCDED